jgi:coproporphyrinogen III oxidase
MVRNSEPAAYLRSWQDAITREVEGREPRSRFREDTWARPGGGGGRARVIEDGEVFERAGVNFSEVHGQLPDELAIRMPGEGKAFYATGTSLVFHPRSPRVPIVHANFRYFERGSAFWFGGGADLTPIYLEPDDVRHFHRTLKAACDPHDAGYYPRFKKWCDDYFLIRHRGERRGVGGVFFDDLAGDAEATFSFVKDLSGAFAGAYFPILDRRQAESFGETEREFQLFRRGRYVEFNLVYDRGTVFGLKTEGRTESILMSLPPLARWAYAFEPGPGSREAELFDVLRNPREWA